ncbi:MAG: YIP1 family protein [Chloroflexi bacterium]|nr:YIP1 family protein [Chloroflexota bacterium]
MSSETRATWSTPMIILSIMAILAVLVAGYFKTRAAMMGEVTLPPDWQYWLPEMQDDYMQAQQATQGPVFMYVIPMVGSLTGLWLGWLVLAGMLHLGSTLFGGRGSMQSALNLAAWGSLPFALRDLLRVIFMLASGHVIASPGLSGFASSAGLAAQLLSRMDIFLLWNFVLFVIGLSILDGLPRSKAFIIVFIVVGIVMSAQAGLGLIGSGTGGSSIQRPFF